MEQTQKIAVLLPVYRNDLPCYLGEAIESMLRQTFNDIQIIVLVDGPIGKDLSEKINSYSGDPRVIIKTFEENRGLPVVLNEGVKICRDMGIQFIARMDADDISSEDRLKLQYSFLIENTGIDLVGTQSYLINSKSEITGKKMLPVNISYKGLLRNCGLVHASVMFRSEFFSRYGLYDERLRKSQDYELWLRATGKGAVIRNLPDYLFYMRYEPGIVKRRKDEQKYNLKIKRQYSSGLQFYLSSWKHYMIILAPSWLITMVLSIKGHFQGR